MFLKSWYEIAADNYKLCQHPPPAGLLHKAFKFKCQLSVNLYQLVSPQYQIGYLLQVRKVTLSSDSWRKCLLGCLLCRSRIRAHYIFWGQNSLSSWICLSTSFCQPCINPQALIRIVSILMAEINENPVWPEFGQALQIFSSLLTCWSNTHFAVSAYGIGNEGQKSSDFSLACVFPVAWQDGNPKDWPAWANLKYFILSKFLTIFFVIAFSMMFIW